MLNDLPDFKLPLNFTVVNSSDPPDQHAHLERVPPLSSMVVRDARTEDIPGIVALVAQCGPYLNPHAAYIYLIDCRYFAETCAVALIEGTIVGWCSMIPVDRETYFLHQLGTVPEVRGRGIAFSLFSYLLGKLRLWHGDSFRLEFTADRRNRTVHRLNRKIAETFALSLEKLPDSPPPLNDGCEEEFYAMTPIRILDVSLIRPAA
jgi:L-2,4-diaminobutyric acid acetyltransferase